jgi:hypothetical protein
MRAIRIAFLSLVGAAALVPFAPVAQAQDGGDVTSFAFSVSPESVAAGGTVTLKASECAAKTVTVSSGVFDPVTLTDGTPGKAQVREDAEPGAAYEATFDCKGEKGYATLTVAEGGSGGHPQPGTSQPGKDEPGTDEPGKHEPGTPQPGKDEPGKDEPGKHEPGTPQPGKHDPGRHEPGKHEPGTVKPGGGVKAGAGGSFSDIGPARLATGTALIAGALGGGVLLLCRRPGDNT